MRIKIFLILLFLKKSASLTCDNDRQNEPNNEKRLKNDLFCKYDNFIRPGSSSNATNLAVRLNVKDFDYNDNQNTLAITTWMTLTWNDTRLTWNSADYGGIGTIHMKSNYLWTPEIKLYNAHIPSSLGNCHPVDCIITSYSKVACVLPCEYTALCKDIGISNWPFDVQNCSFTFGSWMKVGEELNYIPDKITLITKRIKQNNQWKLIAATSRYNRGYYTFTEETFPSISFAFVVERHNGFHQVSSISCGIILMICNLLVFFISPQSMMRLIFCGANIFVNNLFLDFIYWTIPYCADKVPGVFTFFDDLQIYATLILMQSLILKNVLSYSEKPPDWMAKIISKVTSVPISEFFTQKSSLKLPENAEELVEHVQRQANDRLIMENFARLADRLFILLTILLFSFMFLSLFPKGYFSYNYDPVSILS